ncbi:MAG: phosphoadenylyl-sulfate reductase [Saprospiraceae bacterium]|nr:phosphoadenylyl-sulfate reductase [Saprospiraceae bacterium]
MLVKEIDQSDTMLYELNYYFAQFHYIERIQELYTYFEPEDILYTSSFGANSAFLLHLVHKVQPKQKIHFIDTGYHFPDTYHYKNQVGAAWQLNIQTLQAPPEKYQFTLQQELWKTNPNRCCSIHKIEPLAEIKKNYRIWISGLMAYQNSFRKQRTLFERQDGLLKFYPILDVSKQEQLAYWNQHQLPKHPLLAKGYGSVGCTHCTQEGEEREGRWAAISKTECGLHWGNRDN